MEAKVADIRNTPGWVATSGRIWIPCPPHTEEGFHWDLQIEDGKDCHNIRVDGTLIPKKRINQGKGEGGGGRGSDRKGVIARAAGDPSEAEQS